MLGQLDLGEVSLADGLEQLVLADVRLRVGPRSRRLLKRRGVEVRSGQGRFGAYSRDILTGQERKNIQTVLEDLNTRRYEVSFKTYFNEIQSALKTYEIPIN